jgi:hypothetical protein
LFSISPLADCHNTIEVFFCVFTYFCCIFYHDLLSDRKSYCSKIKMVMLQNHSRIFTHKSVLHCHICIIVQTLGVFIIDFTLISNRILNVS